VKSLRADQSSPDRRTVNPFLQLEGTKLCRPVAESTERTNPMRAQNGPSKDADSMLSAVSPHLAMCGLRSPSLQRSLRRHSDVRCARDPVVTRRVTAFPLSRAGHLSLMNGPSELLNLRRVFDRARRNNPNLVLIPFPLFDYLDLSPCSSGPSRVQAENSLCLPLSLTPGLFPSEGFANGFANAR